MAKAKPWVPKHADRVKDLLTGKVATIIDVASGDSKNNPHGRVGIVFDDGPKTTHTRDRIEVEYVGASPNACTRCGDEAHQTPGCQAEYMKWKRERRERQQS